MSAGDKLALAMIPEIDIWRAASLMLKRYGEKALEESAARADELFAEQDHDGAAVWRRIIDAVRQLANTLPANDRAPDRPLRRTAPAGRRRWRLCQPGQSHRRQGARRQRCRLSQEARPGGRRHGQEPLGLSQAAQLPRRDRGRDLLPEARLWFGPLHLARARSLQDLHLVRGGRAQPGPARPSQTGIAPVQTGSFGVGGERKPACLPLLAKRFFRPLLLFQRERRRMPVSTARSSFSSSPIALRHSALTFRSWSMPSSM